MAIVVGIFIGFIAQYRRLYLSRKSCLPISEEKAEKRRTSFMEVPQTESLEEVQMIELPESKNQNTIATVELVWKFKQLLTVTRIPFIYLAQG